MKDIELHGVVETIEVKIILKKFNSTLEDYSFYYFYKIQNDRRNLNLLF